MRNRVLLYGFIGLIALSSIAGVNAYSLFQNLCFPLSNGTPCINWTGTQYEWTGIITSGDGNNYPTNLSVNNTGNNFTIQLGRSGLSTLLANFEVNATGGGNTYNYGSNITFNNGTSINITGNSTNVTIGIPNLEVCSPNTEYSVWNGSHWRCENDNDGTTYTFGNTDTFINVSGTPSVTINANLTSFDLRYTLKSVYDAFVAAIYNNVTNIQNNYVPYSGATGNVTLGSYSLLAHSVKPDASDGLLIQAANSINVASFGLGNTNNTLFYGGVTVEQSLCLAGLCRSTWPQDTYENVTALQGSNATAFLKLDGLYVNVTNLQAVYNYSLDRPALLGNVSSLNATKAGTGAVNCASGTLLQNLTLSSSGVTGQCYTDQTGGSSGGGNFTEFRVSNGTSTTTLYNNSLLTIQAGSNVLVSESAGTFIISSTATGSGSSFVPESVTYYDKKYDFESVTNNFMSPWVNAGISSGTTAVITGEYNRPGLATISSSTTASSGYSYQISGSTTYLLGNNTGSTHIIAPVPKTGNLTTCRLGFQDVFTVSAVVDGAFWNATQNDSSTFNWTPVLRSNSVEVKGNTKTYAASTTSYYRAEVFVINNTQVKFSLYNSTNANLLDEQLINGTVPSVAGRETSHAALCYVNGGTTAQVLARLDYIGVWKNGTITR